MTLKSLLILYFLIGIRITCLPQEKPGALEQLTSFPGKFFEKANKKITSLESGIDRQTEKYLQRLLKKEKKIQTELYKIDSATAQRIFKDADKQYSAVLSPALNSANSGGEYFPHLDSLKTSLLFLDQHGGIINTVKDLPGKIKGSLHRVNSLQTKFKQTEAVKAFIRQRKEQIKEELRKFTRLPKGVTKAYGNFNKEFYYYSQQIQEYKEMLKSPDKITRKALHLLSGTSMFQQFMSRHSELASLFNLPANYGTPQGVVGLQTRTQVQQMIQTQLSGAGPNAQQFLQQNLQAAQQQLGSLKDKLSKFGNDGGDVDMPDFKPNNQKTKTFLQRLELGANLQSAKSNFYFPVTSDIGVSVGYRLNDKSLIGIGVSYKVGWGKDIRNIVVTSEGAGMRSFLDFRLKGSFYVSGGFEYNYQAGANTGSIGPQSWTKSGLIGLSKILSIKTKFFKKTKIQLLWDFLSYRQEPRTQAIKFRIGYNF